MTQEHPITPPEELVRLWLENYFGTVFNVTIADASSFIATQTSQWIHEQRGASNEAELQKARDEELEACCEVLARELICAGGKHVAIDLRDARRPEPPSLQDQALDDLECIAALLMENKLPCDTGNIRRALERWSPC